MRRSLSSAGLALALALALAPASASAQFAIAPKIGTTGLGADVAIGLGDNLAARGGFGLFPVDLTFEAGDINYDFETPNFITVGLDFYPAGSFRLMAGALIRQNDFKLTGTTSGQYEVGDSTYTESGTISGIVTNSSTAPFVGIGFGRHTSPGIGFFIDLGVAFTGDPSVVLDASQNLKDKLGFEAELRREEAKIQADLRGEGDGSYVDVPTKLNLWPFLQIGLKIGLGG